MSRLGAIKMRERRWENPDWILLPYEGEPEPKVVYEKWTEEQARIACGLALFFMKLNPPTKCDWYEYCVDQSCLYPPGSYRYTFWWTMRMWSPDHHYFAKEGWEGWERDFVWKLDQFRSGICHGMQEEHPW